MTTFFTPASFGKNTDVLKFNTIFNSNNNAPKPVNQQNNKQKKKKLKKSAENITAKKIISGRVGKKQKNKQQSSSDIGPTTTTTNVGKKKNKKKQNAAAAGIGAKSTPKDNKVLSGGIKKKKKQKGKPQQQLVAKKSLLKAAVLNATASKSLQDTDVDKLAAQLKESLKGGRFRYINEQLYTMDSKAAAKLFKTEPEAFEAYHEGYRHQVEKWPTNPLKRIIKVLSRLPKTNEIGDFGCGEAQLAKSLPNKFYSIDLVALSDDIIACDMAHTPLNTHSLDVAVYCLSLMGTNLQDYLLEANRVLKVGGLLYIADIQSRFDKNLRPFMHLLEIAGFKLIKQDEDSNVFYHFQFKKIGDVGKVAKLPDFALRPCIYKKR